MLSRLAAISALVTGIITLAVAGASRAAPPVAACTPGPAMLGVTRTVEIDTASGPQFGQQQYKTNDFLQPGEVVLTFDDGPLRPYTSAVLAALDAHCTKATFFAVGKMAIADPDMVREIERRGHTVGSHTWSHRNLRAMSPALAAGEMELGVSAVSKALGHPIAPFFRFPYLSDSRAMIAHAEERNLGMFSIDVDAVDYRTKDPTVVHRRVMAGLKSHGKGIILFHDIQPSTAGALKGLLDEIKAKGFRVVHIVPKTAVSTLAQYDTAAEQHLTRKNQAAAASPLARRSVVWPNAGAAGEASATTASPRPPIATTERSAAGAAQKATPVATAPATATTAPPPAGLGSQNAAPKTPRPASDGDASWRTSIFNDY